MRAIEAVLLALRANAEAGAGGGEMRVGQMAMQGLVYLASLKTPVDATYSPHYYGPRSEGVAEGITRLWRSGCLREEAMAVGSPAYAYCLTGDGERLGAEVAGARGEGYPAIREVVGACRELCGMRPAQMAHAAKIHYMAEHSRRPGAGVAEIVDMGRRAGWMMDTGDVGAGLGLLCRLGIGRWRA